MATQTDLAQPKLDITKDEKERLKYLQFVQAAAVEALLRFALIYAKAKDKSGPLKPGVESVEGAVKTVVGPVYEKYHDLPVEVLKYMDQKVDMSVTELDRRVPPVVKQVSAQAISAAQIAPIVARALASEVRRAGVVETASGMAKSVYTKYEPAAKELYANYEPKAEQCAVSAWKKLNQLPLFPRLAQVAVPTAAFCSEKYNDTVVKAAEKGYRVTSYMPLVPTERISKIFAEEKAETEPLEFHPLD
ncbi:Rubber elongation factor [Arabidopsis thaliana x Arabidopsis arenosa]|uniref:Rubber elongation factor n=1 Tax=Arabidopsis thaliana x Arabidopsis arenosa TaxID=1240361 RepID=A0A8T2AVV8_9BRAS|nr:Rubber elongation factor [Arabidopsis thaliana x Arabidopsis arenosa]